MDHDDNPTVIIATFMSRFPPGTHVRWGRRSKLRTSKLKLDGILVGLKWEERKGFVFVIEWTPPYDEIKGDTAVTYGTHHEFLQDMFNVYCDVITNVYSDRPPKRNRKSIHASRDLQFETLDHGWQPLRVVLPGNVRRLHNEDMRRWLIPDKQMKPIPSLYNIPRTVALSADAPPHLAPMLLMEKVTAAIMSPRVEHQPELVVRDIDEEMIFDRLEDLDWITDVTELECDFKTNPVNWGIYNPSFDDTKVSPHNYLL